MLEKNLSVIITYAQIIKMLTQDIHKEIKDDKK